ncbi:DUF1456 family protein [Aestuariibacter sp. AA17]|uniref:DUF1456 family protein n=1 Tax=Fluctibacter corallii TaxID=2984329 RepID=A0ABT3A801_9ALTE|nr:DUF1456 family protein [Aestuariibacter sp. AA17]MCV2884728.1 DUF1456 family protein [Aestuariibacter sp. AA17]
MFHNDILRRLRFALRINDDAAIQIFKLAGYEMEKPYLHSLMKKEDEDGYAPCRDKILCYFLDGLIVKNRGLKDGKLPTPLEKGERLSNNDVLRKIKIAMDYQHDDILNVLNKARFPISKNELSALFRKPDHRNYRPCKDQLLRNLLQGMVKIHRPDAEATSVEAASPWGQTKKR